MTDLKRTADDLTTAWNTVHDAALNNVAPPLEALGEVASAIEDAKLWRALMGTARMRWLGHFGLEADGTKTPGGDYVHFGMEFWSSYANKPGFEQDNAKCAAMLRAMALTTLEGPNAEAAARATKENEHALLLGEAVILGVESRYALVNFEEMGMVDACEMAPRPRVGKPIKPENMIDYFEDKGLVEPDGAGLRLTAYGRALKAFILENTDAIAECEGLG